MFLTKTKYGHIQVAGVHYDINYTDSVCVVKRDDTVVFEYSTENKTFIIYPNPLGKGTIYTVSVEDGCACINHGDNSYALTGDSSLINFLTTGESGREPEKTYYDLAEAVILSLIEEDFETDAFDKQQASRKMDDIVHLFDLDLSIKMMFEGDNFVKVNTYLIAGVRNTTEGIRLSWQSPVDGGIVDDMESVEAINTIVFYFSPENKRAVLARYEVEDGYAIMNTWALKKIRKTATLFYRSHKQEETL